MGSRNELTKKQPIPKKQKENSDPFSGFQERVLQPPNIIGKIFIRSFHFEFCPICGIRLYKSLAVIPKSTATGIAYPFFSCGHHYFAWPSKKLCRILKANKYTRKVTTDWAFYYPEVEQLRDAIGKCKIKPVVVLLIPKNSSNSQVVVISDRDEDITPRCHLMRYTDEVACRILTGFTSKDGVKYNERQFDAYRITALEKTSQNDMEYEIIARSVMIKPGGGFRSHIKNKRYEIADILFYSPRTKKYEPVHATYDKEEGYCFIDISLYRNFVHDYGNPGIKLYPTRSFGEAFFNRDLNEESILHVYGYNVNSADNLSDGERQAIIAEVIDLELMTQKQIVTFLDFLTHRKNVYPETLQKWKRDIIFTQNYKANPSRFLIYK